MNTGAINILVKYDWKQQGEKCYKVINTRMYYYCAITSKFGVVANKK